MNQSAIEPALREGFLTALPQAADKTAFDNQPFDPKDLQKWYIFTFLPNRPTVATLGSGGQDYFDGLVQIDINIPLNTGKEGVDADIEILRSAFTAGARFHYDSANVIIRGCGRNGPGRPVNGFFRFTLTISWETRINR